MLLTSYPQNFFSPFHRSSTIQWQVACGRVEWKVTLLYFLQLFKQSSSIRLWDSSNTMDAQSFRDSCLIIIGDGGKADELLTKRRLEAGGRLMHIQTEGSEDDRVRFIYADTQSELVEEPFTWQPPGKFFPISKFGQKFGAQPATYWVKTGPDAIQLGKDQEVRVASAQDGVFRHITVVDTDGNVLIDMSGEVVANPSLEIARTFDVEVKNPDFHSFGTLTLAKVSASDASGISCPCDRICHVHLLWATCNRWHHSFLEESDCGPGVEHLQWLMLRRSVDMHHGRCESNREREYLVGNVCVVIFTMGCSFLPLSRNSLSYGCCGVLFASMTFFAYMGPDWRLKDSLLWSVAQLSGTVGTALVMTAVGVMYAFLLMQGQNVVATFFLPLGTALAELGTIIYMRKVYNKLVWSKRSDGIQRVRGDQISICAPVVIICAHGFAEATRFSATFCGAVLSGGYTGIFTTALGMLLNLSARLGWSRYVLIQTTKKLCQFKCFKCFLLLARMNFWIFLVIFESKLSEVKKAESSWIGRTWRIECQAVYSLQWFQWKVIKIFFGEVHQGFIKRFVCEAFKTARFPGKHWFRDWKCVLLMPSVCLFHSPFSNCNVQGCREHMKWFYNPFLGRTQDFRRGDVDKMTWYICVFKLNWSEEILWRSNGHGLLGSISMEQVSRWSETLYWLCPFPCGCGCHRWPVGQLWRLRLCHVQPSSRSCLCGCPGLRILGGQDCGRRAAAGECSGAWLAKSQCCRNKCWPMSASCSRILAKQIRWSVAHAWVAKIRQVLTVSLHLCHCLQKKHQKHKNYCPSVRHRGGWRRNLGDWKHEVGRDWRGWLEAIKACGTGPSWWLCLGEVSEMAWTASFFDTIFATSWSSSLAIHVPLLHRWHHPGSDSVLGGAVNWRRLSSRGLSCSRTRGTSTFWLLCFRSAHEVPMTSNDLRSLGWQEFCFFPDMRQVPKSGSFVFHCVPPTWGKCLRSRNFIYTSTEACGLRFDPQDKTTTSRGRSLSLHNFFGRRQHASTLRPRHSIDRRVSSDQPVSAWDMKDILSSQVGKSEDENTLLKIARCGEWCLF